MEVVRLLLELLVRRRADSVFNGVAVGFPMATTARLLPITTATTRTAVTSTLASAWFATPTSVG